jgi:hypothetical protein
MVLFDPALLQQESGSGKLRFPMYHLMHRFVPAVSGFLWKSLDSAMVKKLNRDNHLRRSSVFSGSPWKVAVERVKGIEPSALAWEARVLPLYDAREGRHSTRLSALAQRLRTGGRSLHQRRRHRVAAPRHAEDATDRRRPGVAGERASERAGVVLRRYLAMEVARGEVEKVRIRTLDEVGADAPATDLEVAAAILHAVEKGIVAAVGSPGVGRAGRADDDGAERGNQRRGASAAIGNSRPGASGQGWGWSKDAASRSAAPGGGRRRRGRQTPCAC